MAHLNRGEERWYSARDAREGDWREREQRAREGGEGRERDPDWRGREEEWRGREREPWAHPSARDEGRERWEDSRGRRDSQRPGERWYGGEQGGYDDPRWGYEGERSRAVMEGGDRGWPGGVTGAEGGSVYGRGFFGAAYSLYAGRPEHEQHGRFERLGHSIDEDPSRRRMGRGPKGYRRSDERVHEDLCERIARSGVNADEVEVRVENGEVTLSGTVASRQEKRYLEDLCEDVFGVNDVHNQIRVSRGETSTGERPGVH